MQVGHTREFFDFIEGHPELHFGGVRLKNCPVPIQVGSHPLFSIKPPEVPGEPFLFSGLFSDQFGNVSLVIEDNEWRASTTAWDIEVKGKSITIREAHKVIHLELRVDPPKALIVERLDMSFAGIHFKASGDFLRVTFPNGGGGDFTSCVIDNCQIGLAF